MRNRVLKHIKREPIPCIGVILFTAILSLILCFLHQSQQKEMEDYRKAYASVPVRFSVVDLDGTRVPEYTPVPYGSVFVYQEGIVGWAADLFYEDSKLEPSFSDLVSDVHLVMSFDTEAGMNSVGDEFLPSIEVVGSTALWLLPELTEEYGGSITFREGYNDTIFSSDEPLCIVPEGYTEQESVTLSFRYTTRPEIGQPIENVTSFQYACTLQVVGYADIATPRIYCPYSVMAQIYSNLHAPYRLNCIGATLNDNNRLEELQQVADLWFARPNPTGEYTQWGHYGYEYYPYALDIDDSLLSSLDSTLERSMTINRLSALAIFLIGAGSGFLVGFLVIRSRKREIILMRTLGCANKAIYGEFAAEQMLCTAVGAVIGGGYTLWQPLGQLGLFLLIYFLGLSAALLIFLHKNLLTTIKEDE